MKAFVLAAGLGTRFRPVTEAIPKPLFPFLNVPLIRSHLAPARGGADGLEAGVNLHHLGEEVEGHLRDGAADLPKLRFFPEPEILGTAGALRNAAGWLSDGDFLVVNTDTVIEPDIAALPGGASPDRARGHAPRRRESESRPVHAGFKPKGIESRVSESPGTRPLLYTGVCVLSPKLLNRIPSGQTALVADLWAPLLEQTREEIGWRMHDGPFADLGRPSDFLRASLEALDRGGAFPEGGGSFDFGGRVLSHEPIGNAEVSRSVLGRVRIGAGASVIDSVVWDGVEIGSGASLRGCLAAGGKILPGARHDGVLLWPGSAGIAVEHPLS